MRIVVFSDMHGNALALEAMLEDLHSENPDQMVCLGDAVQGGPQPVEVVQILRGLGCPVVMGNADAYLLHGDDSGAEQMKPERRRKMDEVRAWQLSRLSSEDIAFIGGFQPTVELPLPTKQRLLCYHGSKKSYDDVILPSTPEEIVRAYLEPEDNTIYTGGHTHMQFVRHFGRSFHFNPGSVGFAYRHAQPEANFRADPWAEYALLSITNTHLRLEFRRVPFDAGQLVAVYRASGRPHAEEAAAQYQGD